MKAMMTKEMTLHDFFLHELGDAYDCETQLTHALADMSAAATSPELKKALAMHLTETKAQVVHLDQVFDELGIKAKGKHCAGMAGIIEEGKDALNGIQPASVLDAAIVTIAHRAEHYEIAMYRSLITIGDTLGLSQPVTTLKMILKQEEAADAMLTSLGVGINKKAFAETPVHA
jgi:ferritin-like metal-binding protein YciE